MFVCLFLSFFFNSYKTLLGQGVLLDRSVFSDSVFAEANYQQGTISQAGIQNYFSEMH